MSNCYSGKDGALSIGGTNVAMLTSWNLTQNAEVLECAYMGATWKDHKTGLLSWEGSCEANFTDTTTDAANANNLVLEAADIGVGKEVALVFYPDVSDTGLSFTGNAIVTSVENGAAIGDVQTVSLSFTGTGSLTNDLVPTP